MPSRHLVLLSACAVALLAPKRAGAATAAPPNASCVGPRVEADATFRQRFPQLLEQLRDELSGGSGVDGCAQVELRATAASVMVRVSLLDERTAAREVAHAEDVLPTLQALLLVPERQRAPEPEPAPTPAPPTRSLETLRLPERDAAPPVTKPREHGFELSVVSGVRVGDGQYGYGGGVLAFIEIKRWLIGFQGRADGYRDLGGSDPETALALGALLGRRFDLGSTALDFTAGPAVALRGASFSRTEVVSMQSSNGTAPPPPPTRLAPENDVGPVPRLLLGARLGFSPRSVFRTFIGIDGELGPGRSADAASGFEASGRMPTYTLGLSLGGTVGTR